MSANLPAVQGNFWQSGAQPEPHIQSAYQPAPMGPAPTNIQPTPQPLPPQRRTIHNGQTISLGEAVQTAVRSLIQGDWLGAFQCAGLALLAIFCFAFLGSVLFALTADDISLDVALRIMPSSLVAAAFGAHWKITIFDEVLGTPLPDREIGYQVIAFPLLITLIGVMALHQLARLPRAGIINQTVLSRQLSQAVRIGVVFSLGCLSLAALSTSNFDGGSSHTGYLTAAFGGFIIATTVCAFPALRSRFAHEPMVYRRLREPIRAALIVLSAMTGLCLILVIIFLATGQITGENGFEINGSSYSHTIFWFGLLFLPNIVWNLQGLLFGVPLTQHHGLNSIDPSDTWWLSDLVHQSAWWLATVPVTIGLLVAVGTAVALRSPGPAIARSRVLTTGVIVGLGNMLLLTFSQAIVHLSFAPGTVTESIQGQIALSFLVPAALTMLAGFIGIGLVKLSATTRV